MSDIRKIDLRLLAVLDALLDEHNVTRAAARLGFTQPTVSGMLTRLRDLFGDPLFVRVVRWEAAHFALGAPSLELEYGASPQVRGQERGAIELRARTASEGGKRDPPSPRCL